MTTQAAKDKKIAAVDRDLDRVTRVISRHTEAIQSAQTRQDKLMSKKAWLTDMPVDEPTQAVPSD